MTSDDRPSTSSAETEDLKLYPAVVTLGMRIVRELGLENSSGTLGWWMSGSKELNQDHTKPASGRNYRTSRSEIRSSASKVHSRQRA